MSYATYDFEESLDRVALSRDDIAMPLLRRGARATATRVTIAGRKTV